MKITMKLRREERNGCVLVVVMPVVVLRVFESDIPTREIFLKAFNKEEILASSKQTNELFIN